MIVKLARFEVRKDEVPKALAAIKSFVDEVGRKEGGTATYKSFQAKDHPTRFTHYMVFRTPSAEQYHRQTPWAKRLVETLHPLCSQEPVFEEVTEVTP